MITLRDEEVMVLTLLADRPYSYADLTYVQVWSQEIDNLLQSKRYIAPHMGVGFARDAQRRIITAKGLAALAAHEAGQQRKRSCGGTST